MARTVSEWAGKSDDHRAPSKVRQRVKDRENSICHLCSTEIQVGQKWDLDHVIAIINGGENRESNLKPAHRKCHKEKTARDVAEKSKLAAIRGKHSGAIRPAGKLRGPAFAKPDKPERQGKTPLPPRAMFKGISP